MFKRVKSKECVPRIGSFDPDSAVTDDFQRELTAGTTDRKEADVTITTQHADSSTDWYEGIFAIFRTTFLELKPNMVPDGIVHLLQDNILAPTTEDWNMEDWNKSKPPALRGRSVASDLDHLLLFEWRNRNEFRIIPLMCALRLFTQRTLNKVHDGHHKEICNEPPDTLPLKTNSGTVHL